MIWAFPIGYELEPWMKVTALILFLVMLVITIAIHWMDP